MSHRIEEGIYVLTVDVKNPMPDKRRKTRGIELVKATSVFVVEQGETAYPRLSRITPTTGRIFDWWFPNGPHDKSNYNALAAAIIPHLTPITDVDKHAGLAVYQRCERRLGELHEAPCSVIQRLLDDGKITAADIAVIAPFDARRGQRDDCERTIRIACEVGALRTASKPGDEATVFDGIESDVIAAQDLTSSLFNIDTKEGA